MSLLPRISMILLAGFFSTALSAAGYEDIPLVSYINPGSDGLKSGHAVGISLFRPNLLSNPSFEADTTGWTLSPYSQMEYHVITDTETGLKHLRMERTGSSTVYASQQVAVADGAYGKSYINGALLVQGTGGQEGWVGLIIESSQMSPVEKKLRFKYSADATWNLVEFNVAQNFTGHTNVKLTFKFYPRNNNYQRLDEVFLDVIPASEVDLPPGVPETSSGSRDVCFASGELAAYDAAMPRQALAGCATGVIVPMAIIESYNPYLADRKTVNCRTTRANEFHTRFLNRHLNELVELADATDRDPQAANVQCAANMFAYWAEQDAMMTASPYGYPQQSRYDRMWVYGGIGAAYLKNPHIRARATEMGKDKVIRTWLKKIGKQLSIEIDDDAANGVQNNGQYWRAFSVLPTALMTQDVKLLKKSRKVFNDAISEIIKDGVPEEDTGFLLNELARESRAVGYHGFAAKPLYGMALYSQAYGCDFMGNNPLRKKQMTRLTRKTIQGFYEPEVFSAAIEKYFGKKGVNVTPNDYRELNYLAYTLNPAIANDVTSFVRTETGNTVSQTYGSDASDDRMGGTYARLNQILPELKLLDPGTLAAECPY